MNSCYSETNTIIKSHLWKWSRSLGHDWLKQKVGLVKNKKFHNKFRPVKVKSVVFSNVMSGPYIHKCQKNTHLYNAGYLLVWGEMIHEIISFHW